MKRTVELIIKNIDLYLKMNRVFFILTLCISINGVFAKDSLVTFNFNIVRNGIVLEDSCLVTLIVKDINEIDTIYKCKYKSRSLIVKENDYQKIENKTFIIKLLIVDNESGQIKHYLFHKADPRPLKENVEYIVQIYDLGKKSNVKVKNSYCFGLLKRNLKTMKHSGYLLEKIPKLF